MDSESWELISSMSCSDEGRAVGERCLVQIAAQRAERDSLVVAHVGEIQVESAVGEVANRLGLTEAGDRRGRQGEPSSSIVDSRTEPGRPGPSRQRFDGV